MLIGLFIVLLIIIPGIVYFNFADQTKKSEEGVLLINKQLFGQEVNENTLFKHLPFMLSRTKEFQLMRSESDKENIILKQIKENEKFEDIIPKMVNKKQRAMAIKPLMLILAHMFRMPHAKDPIFTESMDYIRRMTPQMIALLTSVCQELQQLAMRGQSPKNIPSKVYDTIIHFSQHFVQGMWVGDDPLMQIPQFTPDHIKKYKKTLKEFNIPNSSIDTFCRLTAEQRANLKLFSEQELKDVEALVKVMPVIDVSAKAFTEGEKEMTMSDFITIEIKIKLTNLKDDEFPGYVHSHAYPHLKKQGFWVIISDPMKQRTIIAHKLVFHAKKQTEIRLKDQAEIDKEPLNEEVIEIRQQFKVMQKF